MMLNIITVLCIIFLYNLLSGSKSEWLYLKTDKKGFHKEWNRYGLKRLYFFVNMEKALEHMTENGFMVKIKRKYILNEIDSYTNQKWSDSE